MSKFKQDKIPKVSHSYTAPKMEKYRPITDPRTLTQGQRKKLWIGIQRDNPALADMLTNDPVIADFKKHFDVQVIFYTDEVTEYLKE